MESTINAARDNMERTVSGLKESVATATAGVEQAQVSLRDGMAKAMKTAEELFAFGQGNLDAVSRSGQVFAAGMQDMGQSLAAVAKASLDETVSTMKAMAGVRSLKDAMDLQSGLVRSTLEKAASHTSQMTDSTIKLSEQTFAPIGARLSLAVEKFGRAG